MKYYIVIDKGGANFCEHTWVQPKTRQEMIAMFKGFASDEGKNYNWLTLRSIADLWNVRICEVDYHDGRTTNCPECECPMRRNKCPNCGKEWVITI